MNIKEKNKSQSEKCKTKYLDTSNNDLFNINAKFPKCINIDICDICNYDCVFCPSSKFIEKGGFMDGKLVVRLIGEAFDLGAREICFHLSGEPLINEKLEDYIKYAKEVGYTYIFMTTNGFLANIERMKKIIDAGMNSIRFSLNSLEKKYKTIHGAGDFNKVIENINDLINYKKESNKEFIMGVSIVKTKYTNDDCEILKEQFKEQVDDITIFEVKDEAGQCELNRELYLDSEDGIGVVNKIPCPIPFNSAYVTREGFLTICCADKKNYLAVANLNECTLEEAWNCDEMMSFREKMLNGKIKGTLCYNCIYGKEEEVFPIVDKYSSNYISCDYNKDRLERIEQLKVFDKIK